MVGAEEGVDLRGGDGWRGGGWRVGVDEEGGEEVSVSKGSWRTLHCAVSFVLLREALLFINRISLPRLAQDPP